MSMMHAAHVPELNENWFAENEVIAIMIRLTFMAPLVHICCTELTSSLFIFFFFLQNSRDTMFSTLSSAEYKSKLQYKHIRQLVISTHFRKLRILILPLMIVQPV